MALADLDFMDLYVRLDGEAGAAARFKPGSREQGPVNLPVPPEHMGEVAVLVAALKRDFLINFDPSLKGMSQGANAAGEGVFAFGGMRFRVASGRQANGESWAALRRISPTVRSLEELHFAPHIVQHLQRLGKRDGLILISGATGAGKTTTLYGLLRNYLEHYGGTAMTIEDPVEYTLEGPVGRAGFCHQIQVNDEADWAQYIKSSLRWTPRYIIVGEIRTPRAAEQVLRAATTGHLVLTSVHAGSIEESIHGVLHLAEQAMGDSGARHILAAGLTAALHQNMTHNGPFLRYAVTEDLNNGDPIRSLIRENRVGMINTFIDRQSAKLAQSVRR